MFNVNKSILAALLQYPTSVFWIAYSGGLDSQVLLHASAAVLPAARLRAIHVNHNWRSEAAAWAETCQRRCAQLGIHCAVIVVDAQPKHGESLEACAREARYAAMETLLPAGDCLLTAHHRDDQAETLLLQLLRGAGLRGLSGMPACMALGKAYLIRPLLPFTRAELRQYAEAEQLIWVEDDSNTNLRFSRNFVRHQVLPLLLQRWPAVNKILARVADNTAEAQQLLEELACEDYVKVQGPSPNNVVISRLSQLHPARRRNCLRYWLNQLHVSPPSQQQLKQVEYLLKSKRDAVPQVNWGNVQVRRYQDLLYVLRLQKGVELPDLPILWDLQHSVTLSTIGILTVTRVIGCGIACKKLKESMEVPVVTIALRQGGERFWTKGRLGSHPLKKLFQEWQIPPWQRQKVPLLYHQGKLIAVVDYGVHPNFLASADEWGYVVSLKKCKSSDLI